MSSSKIIEVKDVSMLWHGNVRPSLKDVNLTINRGDFVAITGPNGGGKTTLLRIMLRLVEPTRGSVLYYNAGGECCKMLPMGYLPQKNMVDSRFPITVRQTVELGIKQDSQLRRSHKDSLVEEVLTMIDMQDKGCQGLGTLSGGQLQRVLLGRAIISRPELLVLDEPLSYVDKRFESRVYEIIERIAPHATIVLVSHDMSTISQMANRHLIVDQTIEPCHSGHHFMHYECCDCSEHSTALNSHKP